MSNQLAIAYCLDNHDIAGQLAADVTSLGFSAKMAGYSEHHPGSDLSDFLTSYGGRLLMLATDNFFKNAGCVFNLLPQVQRLAEQNRLTVVVAEGRVLGDDGKTWEAVPTSFDRVSNVIQYMNHWQDRYLELRRQRRQHEDDRLLEEKIEITRRISSEVGELLRFLRNQPVFTLESIRRNHLKTFIPWSTGVLQLPPVGTPVATHFAPQIDLPIEQPAAQTTEQLAEPFTPQPAETPALERSLVDLIQDSKDELMAENAGLGEQQVTEIQEVPAEVAPGDSPFDTQNLVNPPPAPALADIEPQQPSRSSASAQPTSDSNEDEELEQLLNQVFAEEEEYETDEPALTGSEEFDLDSLFGDSDDEEEDEELPAIEDEQEEDDDDYDDALPWEKNFVETPEKVQVEMVANEPLAPTEDDGEPASAEEILEHAISIFDQGEMQKGLNFLHHRVIANPKDTTLRYYFAYALARYGQDFDEASQQLETLIHLDPGHADAWFLQAELSEIRQDYASAREQFEKVASMQPDYPEIFYRLGLLVSQNYEQEAEESVRHFERAIQKNSRNADAHYRLGSLYADQLDQPGKAIEHFQNALNVYATHPFANYDIAVLYHRMGESALANYYYQKAAEINPELKTLQNDAAFQVDMVENLTRKSEQEELEKWKAASERAGEGLRYSPTIEEMLDPAAPLKSADFEQLFTNGHDDKTEPAPTAEELENIGIEQAETKAGEVQEAENQAVEMPEGETEYENQPVEMPGGVAKEAKNGQAEMQVGESWAIETESPALPGEQVEEPENEAVETPAGEPETAQLVQIGTPDSYLEGAEKKEHEAAPSPDQSVFAAEPEPAPDQPTKATPLVFITGASSGIGKATAEIFAKNGYRLLLAARREERLEKIKTNLEGTCNADIHLLHLDVRNLQAVKDAIENLPEDWKNVDILINNAGLARGLAPIHEGDIEHWEQMIDTNIKGLLYLTRAISPNMVARRQGHIINVGSAAGKEVYPKGNVYCATKFAVDALTQGMRLDLYQHGIRVSQVSPGAVEETEFSLVRYDGDEDRAARTYEDFQPLRASDVAEVIYFMATRPPHVNVQDVLLYCTQQGSTRDLDRSGR